MKTCFALRALDLRSEARTRETEISSWGVEDHSHSKLDAIFAGEICVIITGLSWFTKSKNVFHKIIISDDLQKIKFSPVHLRRETVEELFI